MDLSYSQNFYCKISIDGHELISKNIVNCTIREWIFDILPRIEISLFDDGYLTEIFPIVDNSILSISYGVTPEDENISILEFDIVDKVIDNLENNKSQIISLTGILKTTECFFPIKTRSFKNKTSVQVLELIGKEIGLNVKKELNLYSSDLMTWLQINSSNFEFIKHILKRSYLQKDLLFCYTDIYSNFNLNSFNISIKQPSLKARYNIKNFNNYVFENDLEKNIIWYKSFNYVNYTNYFNKLFGYGIKGSFYNFKENKKVEITDNYHPLTENSFNLNSGKIVENKNFPIYTNNIFEEYFKAKIQNMYYKGLFNFSVLLDINAISKVKLFNKVDLVVESIRSDGKDEVQSGEYIVGGIIHSFGNSTLYRKQISLHRNGYNNSQEF